MRLLDRLREPGGFLRSAAILLSGTAAAHLITALALPILTRLYTPADFSTLAVFSSMLFILSSVACLRLEITIPMPKKDAQAFRLLILSIGGLGVFLTILSIIVLIVPEHALEIMGLSAISPYTGLLALGVLCTGGFSIFQNWFVRRKKFWLIARSKIIQSIASAAAQIILFSAGASGLLLGFMLNHAMGCIALGYCFVKQGRIFLNRKRLPATLYLYKNFPKYSTWEALANNMAIQAPIIMIAALAPKEEAGYLFLAMSIIQAPMSLFGNAAAQVYLSHAPAHFQKKHLGQFSIDVLCGLFKVGVGPLLALGIVSPVLISIVFGHEWERAGWLITWMTPWFIFQFLASPISMGIHVAGRLKSAFALQILGLSLRIMSIVISSIFFPTFVSESYAISGAVFYLFYLYIILQIVKSSTVDFVRALRQHMYYVFSWAGVAAMSGYVLYAIQ